MNAPDAAPAPDSNDGPTPAQTAQLQYLDVLPAEPITQAQAADLIAQLEAAPDWQTHLQAWNRDKIRLHPDLFASPQRPFREGRWWQSQITDGSLYGYSFRQPSLQQALMILESLDRQTPGWEREGKKRRQHRFMNELATLSPELCKPGCSFPHELPADNDDSEETAVSPAGPTPVRAPSAPFIPTPYAAMSAPPDAPSRPVWEPPEQPPVQAAASLAPPARRGAAGKWVLALLVLAAIAGAYGYFGFRAPAPLRDDATASPFVATGSQGNARPQGVTVLPTLKALDSQRRAMRKYPDLATSGSPLNRTFVAMVHQLEVERSPKLQQSDWPEQVATECATALLIAPAGQKTLAPTPAARKSVAPTPVPKARVTEAAPVRISGGLRQAE